MKDNELVNHLDHIGMVLKEHNDMFGLLLQQQKDLMVALELVAVSMNSLHECMIALEKLNSINTN